MAGIFEKFEMMEAETNCLRKQLEEREKDSEKYMGVIKTIVRVVSNLTDQVDVLVRKSAAHIAVS
jgi:hypothetical protein